MHNVVESTQLRGTRTRPGPPRRTRTRAWQPRSAVRVWPLTTLLDSVRWELIGAGDRAREFCPALARHPHAPIRDAALQLTAAAILLQESGEIIEDTGHGGESTRSEPHLVRGVEPLPPKLASEVPKR